MRSTRHSWLRATGPLVRWPTRTRVATVGLALAGLGGLAVISSAPASASTITGTMVTQNLTVPGGGAWLPGGGGHFWVSDNALGLCETLPATLTTTKCNGTAKGGQVNFDSAKSLVYVADTSSKTNQVMRFPYNAASDGLGGSTTIQVPAVTVVGGGTGGARAQGVAFVTGPDGAQRLYVSYIKSGDVMQVLNPSGKDKTG